MPPWRDFADGQVSTNPHTVASAAPDLLSALLFMREILDEADARGLYAPGSLGALEIEGAFEKSEAAIKKALST